MDLVELDAASNNNVANIREITANAALGSPGKRKIYLLDEVHMLTTAASNALLKTLEEPPEHVIFILATTDPQKVLPTIRSRTQHVELTLAPARISVTTSETLRNELNCKSTPVVEYVVERGTGSVRHRQPHQVVTAADSETRDRLDTNEAIANQDLTETLTAIATTIEAVSSKGPVSLPENYGTYFSLGQESTGRISEANPSTCRSSVLHGTSDECSSPRTLGRAL